MIAQAQSTYDPSNFEVHSSAEIAMATGEYGGLLPLSENVKLGSTISGAFSKAEIGGGIKMESLQNYIIQCSKLQYIPQELFLYHLLTK